MIRELMSTDVRMIELPDDRLAEAAFSAAG
jgi:hypothetical protein